MSLVSPQTELPRGLSGASDTWDDGPAGVIISGEFFAEPAGGTVFNDSRTEAATAVEVCAVTLVLATGSTEAAGGSDAAASTAVLVTGSTEAAGGSDAAASTAVLPVARTEAGTGNDSHDAAHVTGGTTFNVQGEGLDGTSYTNLVGYAQTAMSTTTTTTPYPNSFAITEAVGFGTHSVSASASPIGGVRGDFSFIYKLPTNRMLNVTVGAVTCNMVSAPSSWSFSGLDNGSPIQHTVDNLGSGYYRLTVWNVRNGSNTLMVAGKDTYGDSFYDGEVSKTFIIADLRLFATGRAADLTTRGIRFDLASQDAATGSDSHDATHILGGTTYNVQAEGLDGTPYVDLSTFVGVGATLAIGSSPYPNTLEFTEEATLFPHAVSGATPPEGLRGDFSLVYKLPSNRKLTVAIGGANCVLVTAPTTWVISGTLLPGGGQYTAVDLGGGYYRLTVWNAVNGGTAFTIFGADDTGSTYYTGSTSKTFVIADLRLFATGKAAELNVGGLLSNLTRTEAATSVDAQTYYLTSSSLQVEQQGQFQPFPSEFYNFFHVTATGYQASTMTLTEVAFHGGHGADLDFPAVAGMSLDIYIHPDVGLQLTISVGSVGGVLVNIDTAGTIASVGGNNYPVALTPVGDRWFRFSINHGFVDDLYCTIRMMNGAAFTYTGNPSRFVSVRNYYPNSVAPPSTVTDAQSAALSVQRGVLENLGYAYQPLHSPFYVPLRATISGDGVYTTTMTETTATGVHRAAMDFPDTGGFSFDLYLADNVGLLLSVENNLLQGDQIAINADGQVTSVVGDVMNYPTMTPLGGRWFRFSLSYPAFPFILFQMTLNGNTIYAGNTSRYITITNFYPALTVPDATAGESPAGTLVSLAARTEAATSTDTSVCLREFNLRAADTTYSTLVRATTVSAADKLTFISPSAVALTEGTAFNLHAIRFPLTPEEEYKFPVSVRFKALIPSGRTLNLYWNSSFSTDLYVYINSSGSYVGPVGDAYTLSITVDGAMLDITVSRQTPTVPLMSSTLEIGLGTAAYADSYTGDGVTTLQISDYAGYIDFLKDSVSASHIPGSSEINESQTDAATSGHTNAAQLEAVAAYLASLSAAEAQAGTAQLNASRTEPAAAGHSQTGTLQTFTSYTALLVAGWGAATTLATTTSATEAGGAAHTQAAAQATTATDTAASIATAVETATQAMPASDTASATATDGSAAGTLTTMSSSEPAAASDTGAALASLTANYSAALVADSAQAVMQVALAGYASAGNAQASQTAAAQLLAAALATVAAGWQAVAVASLPCSGDAPANAQALCAYETDNLDVTVLESSTAVDAPSALYNVICEMYATLSAVEAPAATAVFPAGLAESIAAAHAQQAGLVVLRATAESAPAGQTADSLQAHLATSSEATDGQDLQLSTMASAVSDTAQGSAIDLATTGAQTNVSRDEAGAAAAIQQSQMSASAAALAVLSANDIGITALTTSAVYAAVLSAIEQGAGSVASNVTRSEPASAGDSAITGVALQAAVNAAASATDNSQPLMSANLVAVAPANAADTLGMLASLWVAAQAQANASADEIATLAAILGAVETLGAQASNIAWLARQSDIGEGAGAVDFHGAEASLGFVAVEITEAGDQFGCNIAAVAESGEAVVALDAVVADLQVILDVLKLHHVFLVEAENRSAGVAAEVRQLLLEAERRGYQVSFESREHPVAGEVRVTKVRKK